MAAAVVAAKIVPTATAVPMENAAPSDDENGQASSVQITTKQVSSTMFIVASLGLASRSLGEQSLDLVKQGRQLRVDHVGRDADAFNE